MALMITEDCTLCDACVDPCPNFAITAGEDIYVIDPSLCTECVGAEDEPQCVLECPSNAIIPDPDFPESKEELLEKYKKMHD